MIYMRSTFSYLISQNIIQARRSLKSGVTTLKGNNEVATVSVYAERIIQKEGKGNDDLEV